MTLRRFHDVTPQLYLDMVPPRRLSQKVRPHKCSAGGLVIMCGLSWTLCRRL